MYPFFINVVSCAHAKRDSKVIRIITNVFIPDIILIRHGLPLLSFFEV